MFANIYTCFPPLFMTLTGAVGPMTLTFPSTSGPGPTSAALKFYMYSAEIAILLRLMLIPVFHTGVLQCFQCSRMFHNVLRVFHDVLLVVHEVLRCITVFSIMENWNQDHPERYSNFHRKFVKFQGCGKWPWSW